MNLSKKLILLVSAFLVSCTYKTPVGPTHVSSKAYFCRGSWHFPQAYYEYDEIGIASWYGDDCHGKAKATGEKFNKMALTAAHKTLPIPSVVKVTSLKTGKSIIVVVDDRGPFVYKGRIIDLSYAAARELGIHKFKPSPVRVQTLVEDSLKLSKYIAQNCKSRKDPKGRSWAELYFNEIRRDRFYSEPAISSKKPLSSKESTQRLNKKPVSHKISKPKRGHKNLGSYLNKI